MDIIMPQLGETVAEGTVTNWYKKVGDTIRADEALFDVETDKVATEIPCPIAGVVTEVLVPAGKTVKVGTRLAVVRGADEPVTAGAPAVSSAAASSSATPVTARGGANTAARSDTQKLSPVVRRLLAEHKLDAEAIRGSGRDGRVTREDVLRHVDRAARAPSPLAPQPAIAPPPAPVVAGSAIPTASTVAPRTEPASGEIVVALNTVRRKSAAAMARAWQAVPHVLQAVEADYSRIEAARRVKGGEWRAREGFDLTYLPFLAWTVCRALARYEQLNARIAGDDLIVSRRVHLGIAVDLDHDGLVVPVIRDAQDKNVAALARDIRRLARGARAGKLKPDDFSQPTYTISNSGVFGTLITAPIVNPPQVAVLSTDGVRKRPVVIESAEGDSIAIRPIGVLAQSFDHRAVDGAYSAAFLRELKRVIETRDWTEELA